MFLRQSRTSVSRRWRGQLEHLEARDMLAADFFVANTGDDWAAGSMAQPFKTLRRALDAASVGDTITLRNGVYDGGINIDIDNLTIRSMPGEWAVIQSPLTQFTDGHANSVIRYNFDVQGGRLENLEITGGYYYGVMFWDWWDSNWDSGSTHTGPNGITIEGCKIHDTGVDAIKITPGADDIHILNNEIYNTGRRTTSSADGIDNNNGDRMIARGNYIHDIPGIGVVTTGGTTDSLIEHNLIQDTAGAGIVVGFYSESEWMEPADNPNYFTSRNTIARNNIIVSPGQAGIGIYASLNPQVYNNTIVDAARDAQAPLQLGGVDIWLSDADPYHHVASQGVLFANNIITTNPDNETRMVDIRLDSYVGSIDLDNNLYHGSSTRGILFIDRNLTGDGTPEQTFSQWKTNYGHDVNSLLGDPQLGADFATPPAAFGAPSIEIAQRAYHDYESKTLNIRVVRHGSTSDTVTVSYQTLEGTARAGLDYQAVSGQLIFAPGETEKIVAIALLGDALPEGDEHFLFQLSNAITDGSYPVRLGYQRTASLTIDDVQTPITLHYRTLFVAPNGSDVTGDGSEAMPWKSLQHAADQVGPGDYVIVKPGQYWGMNLTTDGKPDARITFYAMPGVIIDEPDPERHQDGINLEGADYVTIEGFEIHDMPRAGIRAVNNTGAIIRGNLTDHNGSWGILTGWSYNLLVENNIASRSQKEHGIYISNSSDDGIIRNNVVWGNRSSGIQFNADAYLPGDGVHSRNIIEGNVLYDNGVGGGAAINLDGFQDGIVRNNLLYNNHATGIVLYVGFAADSSTNNLVQNNTVVMADDARWALLMTDSSSGNTIVNNILLNKNPNRGSMTVESNSLPARSDFNVVQDLFQLDGYNGSFAQWQSFSGGQDGHSFFASLTDLFVDPAGNDYHLKAGSPAIDVGDPTGVPAVDLYQHARPQGAGVDIGALESGQFASAVQFEWQHTIGYEFIGMAEVAIVRTGDTEGTLVVDVQSVDGSATGADYTPVSEQVVFAPGQTRKTIRVFVTDDSAIEDMETLQLNLAINGVPTDQMTLHVISDDAWRPGKFAFGENSVTVDETTGAVTITVKRVDGSNGPASVKYKTDLFTPPKQATWVKKHTDLLYPTDNDKPATPGADFTPVEGWLNFADGETTKTITIGIIDDLWYETDEAFVVKLSDPSDGASLSEKTRLKIRIISDDVKQPGTFVFAASSYVVTEGTPSLAVTVNRINGSNVEASVRIYHTGAGNSLASAWSPTDYDGVPELLTFGVGETSKTIVIPIVDDAQTEADEAFSMQLYSPTNDATVGDPFKTFVTIKDNESTFYFRSQDGSSSFGAIEGSGNIPITVIRHGALATPASVRVNTGDWGSATSGVDFTPLDVVLNFAVGEVEKTIYVTVANDMLLETKESFPVSMSNAIGAGQGSWTWSANITDDDVAASPGKLELSQATYSVSEAGGALNVVIQRVGGSDGTVAVQYRTRDGATGFGWDKTAYAGSDYSSKSGVVTFAAGETSKTISIPITNDTSIEKDEVFTIELSNPAGGATLGAVARAVVTIVEDDSAIEFGTSSYTVNESAGFVSITIIRKGSTVVTASVDLKLSSSSAQAGKDFVVPASPQVVFADGESVKTIQIQIIDDVFKEADEWFGLSLTNAIGAKLGSSLWGNVKIAAND